MVAGGVSASRHGLFIPGHAIINRFTHDAALEALSRSGQAFYQVASMQAGDQNIPNTLNLTDTPATLGSDNTITTNDPDLLPSVGYPYFDFSGATGNEVRVDFAQATLNTVMQIEFDLGPDGIQITDNGQSFSSFGGVTEASEVRLLIYQTTGTLRLRGFFQTGDGATVDFTGSPDIPAGTRYIRGTLDVINKTASMEYSDDRITWTTHASVSNSNFEAGRTADFAVLGRSTTSSFPHVGSLMSATIINDGQVIERISAADLDNDSGASYTTPYGGTVTLLRTNVGGFNWVSPSRSATRLDQVDDWIQTPIVPTFDGPSGSFTALVCARNSSATSSSWISTEDAVGNKGILLFGASSLACRVGSGGTFAVSTLTGVTVDSNIHVVGMRIQDGILNVFHDVSGFGPDADASGEASVTHDTLRVSTRRQNGTLPLAGNVYSIATFTDRLSDDEMNSMAAYMKDLA